MIRRNWSDQALCVSPFWRPFGKILTFTLLILKIFLPASITPVGTFFSPAINNDSRGKWEKKMTNRAQLELIRLIKVSGGGAARGSRRSEAHKGAGSLAFSLQDQEKGQANISTPDVF